VSMPSVPWSDWTTPIAKAEKGEPLFKSVDNPGKWPQFTYWPKFQNQGPRIMLTICSLLGRNPCR
jgi:hypothetical protein